MNFILWRDFANSNVVAQDSAISQWMTRNKNAAVVPSLA